MASGQISRRALARVVATKLTDPQVQKSQFARTLAAYLIEHNMTGEVEMLLNDVARELASRKQHVYATVSSARELSEGLKKDIIHYVKTQFDTKNVELVTEIDPTLIGGIKIEVPDMQLDMTVRSKLKRLSQV